MAIYLGTSGWAYASWKPDFYPAKLPAKKFLEYYATRLNSVEVNYTFRQLPSQTMLAGWMAASAPSFLFSFKAPQRVTHFARLKGCNEHLHAFFGSLLPLSAAGRMGIVLFQLPPNFKADAELLDNFLALAAAHGAFRLAFEFRNQSWFCEDVYAVLRRHGAALCAAESDDLQSPEVATAAFQCYRLRKSDYSPAELDQLAASFQEKGEKADVFVYFKHEDEPKGAINAAAMLERLTSGGPLRHEA